ncbi:TetR family transcriptional regulator [Pontibacter ummariensis]|uniref:Transcriptional regulator, TetR family n=1 Tax=Pontibacter ummariensis TaxID=1610492 RepID=A0A239GU69_9BACT|nr:TetR/AcrR family transcriptional regulator [Pontibacter ummariensis]PRY11033.1 TetR family transcriptional regulator [Pontibacter ummariensis]SNS72392.1 transcriptional regulator, TetR family [Pontibacter ummariensis]
MGKKAEVKRELILEAAKSVFGRLGYSKATLDDIAAAIGMKKPSLYYYYKSKEVLFVEAFSQEWKSRLSHIKHLAEHEQDPHERLLLYIRSSLRYYQEIVTQHTISIRVLVETRATFQELFKESRAKESNYYASVIKEGVANGTFKECEAERVGYTIMTVKDLIQFEEFERADFHKLPSIDFEKIERDVLYTVNLVLNGIAKA